MEEKKKNKKMKFIIPLIVVLLIIAIIGAYFGYKYWKDSQTTGTDWGDAYFERLQEDIKKGDYSNVDNNSIEICFMPLKEDSTPMMTIIYKEKDKKKIDIYRERNSNNEDNKNIFRTSMTNEENTEDDYNIKYLYNIEQKENRWYITMENSKMISYNDVKKRFDELDKAEDFNNIIESEDEINKNRLYNFNKEEIQQATISKFEETFVTIDDELVKKLCPSFTITIDMKEKDIKSEMKENISKYNQMNEEINNEIKTATENNLKELEAKKEEIKIAEEQKPQKEAEEAKKAEEETRIKAEEEAKELKVGNYTIKYGTYIGYETLYDPSGNETVKHTVIIKQDGTITHNGNSGKYTVSGNYIKGNSGMPFKVTGNNQFTLEASEGINFTYQGN